MPFESIKDAGSPKQPMRAWRADYKTEPPTLGKLFPLLVPAIGPDGNELGGIRLPELSAPLALYRGWNYRADPNAPKNYINDMVGSTFPLPKEKVEKLYSSKVDYVAKVRAHAQEMIQSRLLLERDLESVVARAGQAWDWLLSSK